VLLGETLSTVFGPRYAVKGGPPVRRQRRRNRPRTDGAGGEGQSLDQTTVSRQVEGEGEGVASGWDAVLPRYEAAMLERSEHKVLASRDCAVRHHSEEALDVHTSQKGEEAAGRAAMLARLRTAGIGAWTAGAGAGAGAAGGPVSTGDEKVASLPATVDWPSEESAEDDDALNTAVQTVIGADAVQEGVSSELHRSLVSDVHTRLRKRALSP
jgi:hypothetical protein